MTPSSLPIMADIERMLRKELRISRIINPEQEVALIDDGSAESRVARILLERILRADVRCVPPTTRKRANLVRATSLERELARGLRALLERLAPVPRGAPIMATIPEAMIIEFAKRHNIRVALPAQDPVRILLERLQAAQPQTKAALRRSFDHIGRIPRSAGKRI